MAGATKLRPDEQDLEDAILREIEAFLLEFGTSFTFVARQKGITIDGDDYYIDLLLFHRGLRRLVAIELLELDQSHIRVAEYLLEMPPKETLARKLHAAIQRALARLDRPQDTVDELS